MVFQSYALYPHLSVYDNIAFSLKLHGKAEIARRVNEAAHVLGLGRSSTASRARSPAASASAWPWAARSCATRRRS